MKILLENGRLTDPSQTMDETGDILIENGQISRIGPRLRAALSASEIQDTAVFDLTGMVAAPGLIDMHTHLREPGFEYKETIASGSAAAAAGGFTSIACMANTDPCNDNRSVTEYIIKQARQCGLVRVYPVGAISSGLKGTALAEYGDMKEGGIVALSDDGKPVMNSHLMKAALEYAASLKLPVIAHCEDINLSGSGVMNESFFSTELGLPGIPSIAEESMIARDILLAGYTRTAVHIAHVSTKGGAELIRTAKKKGIHVTAETAPHYFTLCDESLRTFDTCLKVNPPLRSREDVEAIKDALKDGTIDAIASDHAPHAITEKDVEFEYALSGMIGLETSLALSLRLVAEKVLTLPQLIEKMSVNPARILRLPLGSLALGAPADITVFDANHSWTVDREQFFSKSKNTPCNGWQMTGKAMMTLVDGEVKYNALPDAK
ncbi:MAG: dihydroorotase [Syntrophobacterales bacterium]|jgi:dihydroorotase|nr:dihydroorotase [Syntrophobacterales bacterium]